MNVPVIWLVLVAAVMLMAAGFCAAADAAFTRISRGRAEELRDAGRRGGSALVKVTRDSAPVAAVVTYLRVAGESGAVVCVTLAWSSWQNTWWITGIGAAITMTAAIFAAVGVGPRTLGRQHADTIGLLAAPTMVWFSRVLGPFTRALVAVANVLTPGRGYRDGPFDTEAELRELVDLAEENRLIEADERQMIHSVFELGDTLARSVMVPRTDVVSIDHGRTLQASLSLFLRSGYSRVPVIGADTDDIRGMLYLKDVVRVLHEDPQRYQRSQVDDVMRTARFVPDSKPVDDLLRDMQANAEHVAIVVDEYGGTAGMVTLEDIVEEIVGEISDEYDVDTPATVDLGDGSFRVPARMHLDDVGDLVHYDLDDDEVDTIGGLLAKALGRVPIAGSSATLHGVHMVADRFEGRRHRLATVIVSKPISVDDGDDTVGDEVPA